MALVAVSTNSLFFEKMLNCDGRLTKVAFDATSCLTNTRPLCTDAGVVVKQVISSKAKSNVKIRAGETILDNRFLL